MATRRITRAAQLATVAILAAVAGCAPAPEDDTTASTTPSTVPVGFTRATTSGPLATSNLSAQIDGYESALAAQPTNQDLRAALTDRLLSRSALTGTFSDLDRARELSVEADHHLQARVLSAVHEFEAATQELSLAPGDHDLHATIAVATGADLADALATREAAAANWPNFGTLAGLAAVHGALGNFEVADALYLQALDSYTDVSPFPVAWVAFQRGVMWGEKAGRPDLARPLYEEAVARLPGYVVANVHLAELEALAGEREQAIARLAPLVEAAEDPEPAGLMAELVAQDAPIEAAALAAWAQVAYESLLQRHPRAFLDHGAEFFMGPGADPERALAMALDNLETRQDDRAWQIAIEAAVAAGENAMACDLATLAGEGRASVPLAEVRGAACGASM